MEENVPPQLPLDEGPVPYEGEGSWFGRFGRTLRDGLRPRASAATFGQGRESIAPALGFAFLTFTPLAALQGIIPYTHTMVFKPGLGMEQTEVAAHIDTTTDILRAAGLGLLINTLSLLALTLAFSSLAGAFGAEPKEGQVRSKAAGARACLYRAWLFPMQGVLGLPGMFFGWLIPSVELGMLVGLITGVAFAVAHFLGLWRAAEVSARTSPGGAMAVAIVPFILVMVVQWILVGQSGALLPLLPAQFAQAPL